MQWYFRCLGIVVYCSYATQNYIYDIGPSFADLVPGLESIVSRKLRQLRQWEPFLYFNQVYYLLSNSLVPP